MAATTVYLQRDGPYVVTGRFKLAARGAPRDDASVVLCRCGHSDNKPYCDGSHTRIGFVDPGLVAATGLQCSGSSSTPLAITPEPDGPLVCLGPLVLLGVDGSSCERDRALLCRCGASATKPFCDCRHDQTKFTA